MNGVVGDIPVKARRALKTAVVMVCAVGLLAAMGGQALAKAKKHKPKKPPITTHTPLTRGTAYLALGDSVTFGYEEAQVLPPPNYQDASSFLGYPEFIGSGLHVTVANAACPGETSASFIDPSQQSNGCENTPGKGNVGYRTMFPLHVRYSGSQLGYAVKYLKKHKKVRLVSLMIGANDGLVCQETTADHCASLLEQAGVIGTVSKNVNAILSAIRHKAKYRGQLAIVNYYSTDYSNPATTAQITALNQAIDAAAAPFKVVVADGFRELANGAAHAVGSSGESTVGNTCNAGLLTQLVNAPTKCGIHPSYSGQALLAQALEKVLRLS